MTTPLILLLLALLWAAYLVPPMIRNRGFSLRFSRAGAPGSYSRSLAGLDQAHAKLNVALTKAIDQGRPEHVVPLRVGSTTPQAVAPAPAHGDHVNPLSGSSPIGGTLTQGLSEAGPQLPPSPLAARQRRRTVLLGLVGIALLTLVAALTLGGIFFIVHLLADAVLLGWVVLLVQRERDAEARRTKVHPIRPAHAVQAVQTHSHSDYLRQSGS